MGISPFRRGVSSENKQNFGNKQFKNGGKKFWFEKWRLPQGSPAPFVLISGDYVDQDPSSDEIEYDPVTMKPKEVKKAYFKLTKHKRKLMRHGKESYADTICSAGPDLQNPQPCAGCMAMDAGDKTVTKSEQFAFTIVHLHPYHIHPLTDRETGKFVQKKSENGGGYVMIDSECTGRTCNFCAVLKGKPVTDKNFPAYQASDIGTTLGKKRYLEVGKGHLSNLGGWDASIRSQCVTCKGMVDLVGYSCGICDGLTIDASKDNRSDAELEEAVIKPYPCPTCKRATLHKEVVGCQTCEAQGKTAVQGNLFGTVLWGSRQGEGTKSQLMLSRFESFEEHNSKVPASLLNGRTVAQIVEEIGKPYNFNEVMAPEGIQEQAQRLDISLASLGHSKANMENNQSSPFMPPNIPMAKPQPQFASYPQSPNGQLAFIPPLIPVPGSKQ